MAHSNKTTCLAFLVFVSLCPSLVVAVPAQPVLPPSLAKAPSAVVDYADVRARVANAFAEKAHEMSAVIAVLQKLSKETTAIVETINTHCGVKLEAAESPMRSALRK